jgi:LacI family transcriptional regulator, galactose operon repressor
LSSDAFATIRVNQDEDVSITKPDEDGQQPVPAPRRGAPTLVDVARGAGVSVSTAGRVMRDGGWPVDPALRERVRETAAQLGYVPNILARTLRGSGPALVGLVAGNMLDPYYGEIAEAVTRHAEAAHPMMAMVCNMQRDPLLELKYCRQLWEHRVAGLILAGGGFDQITHRDELAVLTDQMIKSGVVVTLLSPRDLDAPQFCVDNRRVGEMAASELIRHGHRRVGIAIGRVQNLVRRQRLEAMITAFDAAGVRYTVLEPDQAEAPEAAISDALAANRDITGLVASTHMISMGIINELQRAGLSVPDDISVVAIGNAKLLEWSTPRLTHIDLKLESCGRAALDFIAARVSAQAREPGPMPEPRLVHGESVIACGR